MCLRWAIYCEKIGGGDKNKIEQLFHGNSETDLNEEDSSVLKKMRLVGAAKSAVNFEWPKQEELEQIPNLESLKLNSISFKQGKALKGIKLGFTDGIESPLFEAEKGSSLLDLQTAKIDTTKKISRIALLVTKSKTKHMIWGIKLYGENEDEILVHLNWLDFNPDIAEWVFQDVPDGKEVIGVYGRKEKELIVSLGFILWTPEQVQV